MIDPKIVRFDELTTGQDPIRRNTILGMIAEYKKKFGFTAILISHDIPDVEGAKKFYTQLFGWETEDMPMENMSYSITKIGDQGVGGIMPLPPEAEGVAPRWGVYVTVDDVDATARKAEDLGGKIHVPPTDIPNVGRFCVIQDPQGSVISAITYEMDD